LYIIAVIVDHVSEPLGNDQLVGGSCLEIMCSSVIDRPFA
jgi:hypothetical protein